jgi:hypothetical protein
LPDLRFQIEDALATPNAAAPQLSFKVRITDSEPEPIHSIARRARLPIEPVRRRYTAAQPERWSKAPHPLLWTNTNVNVSGFTGSSMIKLRHRLSSCEQALERLRSETAEANS